MSRLVLNKYSPDKKDLSILFTFLIWLIIGFVIMLIGINNVFALETNFENLSVQGYNNNGTSLTNPSVFNCSAGSCGMEITTNVNSFGGAWAIQSPIPLLKNHTYTLSLRIRNTAGIGITLSSKNRIAIGNSIDSVKYNYEIADYWNTLKSSVASGNYTLQFVFTPTGQASYLLVPFTTNRTITTSFMIDNIIIEDLGSEGVTQEEINNSLNNQTNTLNSSIQNSTDTITGEINDMEQSIIDSNKETQDVIKDQFNECHDSYNILYWTRPTFGTLVENNDGSFNWSYPYAYNLSMELTGQLEAGTYTLSNYSDLTLYIQNSSSDYSNPISKNNSKTFNYDGTSYLRLLYASTTPNTSQLFKVMIVKGDKILSYEPYGEEICTNRIDETNDKLDDVNNTSKGIWETIKNLPNMFLDMLLGLFIPKDLSFINEFKDVISNKLGFIASVPIQIIDFALGLADVAFNEITTISFPSVEIFGVHFWNAEEIDITILLEKLKPFKYFTDFTCVILCCRTLYDMYHNFTGGGAD